MAIHRQRLRQCPVAVAILLAFSATAHAGDPEPAPGAKSEPKAVRKVGGERGAKVEAKGTAEAAPGEAGPARERGEKMRAMHEGMKDAREEKREGHHPPGLERAAEAKDAPPGTEAATPEQERERTRVDRGKRARRMLWMALMHRFRRPSEIPPDVRNELQHHARRLARLQRIRELAQIKKDKKTLDRVDKLIAREQERHDKKMQAQAGMAGKMPGGTPPANAKAAAQGADPDDEADEPERKAEPKAAEAEDEEEGAEP